MKDKDFEKYIDYRLENGDFDDDGTNACAVIRRERQEGSVAAFKFELKQLYGELKYFLTGFAGLETPIGWFIQLLFLPLLFLIIPFTRTYFRYKRAIDAFKESYERDLKSGKYVAEK